MTMVDHTHNIFASSWVDGADDHADFPVQNLPLGLFSFEGGDKRIGTAIGPFVLDLTALAQRELLPPAVRAALQEQSLNALFALPPADRRSLRHAVFALLTSLACRFKVKDELHPADECEMHLPCAIGDYTDFYVGIHHAINIGRQFRPDNPLLPNYKHVPIGYHGRASSVRPSGTPVVRPRGQFKHNESAIPELGATRRLDFELELGVWISGENELGESVPIELAPTRLAGLCLLNDWSARDLQAWEYQPLGPFLAKSFLTTVSPWVITTEALAPFRTGQPARPAGDPAPLPYLWHDADQSGGAFSLTLQSHIATSAMRKAGLGPHMLGQGPASSMYWTVAQMITHHTINGCNLRPGDLLGTGTISTPDGGGLGSLMELSQGGSQPVELPNGELRSFLEDGDELILSARANRDGYKSIGFGQCSGVVLQPE